MEMSSYLAATEYSDAGHPGVKAVARELVQRCRSDRERAVMVFEWVQDQIRYRIFHDWSQKASETLELRGGACTNKANLYVAFMRALGIPAGFHVMSVNGQCYFGPVWVPMVARLCSQMSVHVFPTVYLDGQWLKCDPTDDLGLTEGTAHLNPPSERVVFDGERHALLKLDPAHVHQELDRAPSIDHVLAKRTNKPAVFFHIMDLYLEFGRRIGAQQTLDTAEGAFRAWLTEYHPDVYSEFRSREASMRSEAPATSRAGGAARPDAT